VRRLAVATLVVSIANAAYADTAPSPAKPATPATPDEIADIESREANLERKEPRNGLTFTAMLDADVMLGNGVGRGVALSFRIGHVATRKTVITFEATLPNSLHKMTGVGGMEGPLLVDTNACFFAGAQRYTGRTKWLRAAGGLTALNKNARADGSDNGDPPIAGIGALVGAGADFVKIGPWISGELMFMGSLSRDGLKVVFGAGLGLMFP